MNSFITRQNQIAYKHSRDSQYRTILKMQSDLDGYKAIETAKDYIIKGKAEVISSCEDFFTISDEYILSLEERIENDKHQIFKLQQELDKLKTQNKGLSFLVESKGLDPTLANYIKPADYYERPFCYNNSHAREELRQASITRSQIHDNI
jgi:hypothetical protein